MHRLLSHCVHDLNAKEMFVWRICAPWGARMDIMAGTVDTDVVTGVSVRGVPTLDSVQEAALMAVSQDTGEVLVASNAQLIVYTVQTRHVANVERFYLDHSVVQTVEKHAQVKDATWMVHAGKMSNPLLAIMETSGLNASSVATKSVPFMLAIVPLVFVCMVVKQDILGQRVNSDVIPTVKTHYVISKAGV